MIPTEANRIAKPVSLHRDMMTHVPTLVLEGVFEIHVGECGGVAELNRSAEITSIRLC